MTIILVLAFLCVCGCSLGWSFTLFTSSSCCRPSLPLPCFRQEVECIFGHNVAFVFYKEHTNMLVCLQIWLFRGYWSFFFFIKNLKSSTLFHHLQAPVLQKRMCIRWIKKIKWFWNYVRLGVSPDVFETCIQWLWSLV